MNTLQAVDLSAVDDLELTPEEMLLKAVYHLRRGDRSRAYSRALAAARELNAQLEAEAKSKTKAEVDPHAVGNVFLGVLQMTASKAVIAVSLVMALAGCASAPPAATNADIQRLYLVYAMMSGEGQWPADPYVAGFILGFDDSCYVTRYYEITACIESAPDGAERVETRCRACVCYSKEHITRAELGFWCVDKLWRTDDG